ncbi:Vesicle-associated membrane protein 711 [Camellia lanceoleosa]|uniref:Vesicle-associated membrane protein 711 n=1 Tax=Camellia lanceoleosa TaxID=1840588 RepID=A0ACC0G0M2_9ERIC|nr:Vesicle-associated membrane protein 711 [Camellia lanceoleosa]
MAILYALVARGSVVLAEFSATSTNASTIARQILEKIPGNNDSNLSYSQDRYIFHVKRTDGLTVLCMADDTAGRRIPFTFLEDIHQRFVRTYGRAVLSAHAYAMNDEFSRVLSQQMEYYSNDPNADRINRLKGEMSQVRNVMIENIDKVLEVTAWSCWLIKQPICKEIPSVLESRLAVSETPYGGEMSSSRSH